MLTARECALTSEGVNCAHSAVSIFGALSSAMLWKGGGIAAVWYRRVWGNICCAVFAVTGTIQEICLLFFEGLQERRWILRYGVLMACFWWSCGL